MAQKMSLIKATLGTTSNSLREYSRLTGKSAPDSISELNSYSQIYLTLQICGGSDTYVSNVKNDYVNDSLINKLVGDSSNTYYTVTGFTTTTSGRTQVYIQNYSPWFTSCYEATHTTITGIRQGVPDEGSFCDASLNDIAIIDFGSTWSTTTTFRSILTGQNMPAEYYLGQTPGYTKSIRYWNGSVFVGDESFC